MGDLLIVTSGKGGVGTSIMAADLAAVYGMKGKSVVLVDLAFGRRTLDLYLGKEDNVVYDFGDVIKGTIELEQALLRDDRFENLYLLPAGAEEGPDPDKVLKAIDILKLEFDKVIVDLPAYISCRKQGLKIAEGADRVIAVSSPEIASVRNTEKLISDLRGRTRMPREKVQVILNSISPELMNDGVIPKLSEIGGMMTADIAGALQEDRLFSISASLGIPIVLKEDAYLSKTISDIADRI